MATRCVGVPSSLPNLTKSSKLRCRVSSLGNYGLELGRLGRVTNLTRFLNSPLPLIGAFEAKQLATSAADEGYPALCEKSKYGLDNGRVLILRDGIVTRCRRMDNQECGDGRVVDENMILLRLRIKEMERVERGDEGISDSNWMEWEKKYFMHFHEAIYQIIGYMQHYLMSVRPCLALGIIAFVISSVVFSTIGITFQSMEMFKEFTTLLNTS